MRAELLGEVVERVRSMRAARRMTAEELLVAALDALVSAEGRQRAA